MLNEANTTFQANWTYVHTTTKCWERKQKTVHIDHNGALIKYSRAIQCKQHWNWLWHEEEKNAFGKKCTYIHHCRIRNWTLINIVWNYMNNMGMSRHTSLALIGRLWIFIRTIGIWYTLEIHIDWQSGSKRTKEFWFCTERRKKPNKKQSK